MMRLPYDDPGLPDTRSPARLLLWVGRRQLPTLIAGIVLGILWMVAQAMMPYAIGRAIGDGLTDGDNRALALWSVVLLGLGVLQAVAGIVRHRDGRAQLAPGLVPADPGVVHHVARTGPAVRTRLTTGEVVATVSNDAHPRRRRLRHHRAARRGDRLVHRRRLRAPLRVDRARRARARWACRCSCSRSSFVIRPLQRRQREQRERSVG